MQSASFTVKAPPAKLHHAATYVDREDNRVPGKRISGAKKLDFAAAIRQPHLLLAAGSTDRRNIF
jgi:hypothetical protein